MPTTEDDTILRRIEALERATEKRLDDARDIHRREHEAYETSHADSHADYRTSHTDQHNVEKEQRDQARVALDHRLEGMNEIRAQLNTQAGTFFTIAAATAVEKAVNNRIDAIQDAIDRRLLDATKHTDERYEENRRRIELLEKGDVKAEGKSLGQGATVAIIVTAIGVVGTVLAIIITLANFATGQ